MRLLVTRVVWQRCSFAPAPAHQGTGEQIAGTGMKRSMLGLRPHSMNSETASRGSCLPLRLVDVLLIQRLGGSCSTSRGCPHLLSLHAQLLQQQPCSIGMTCAQNLHLAASARVGGTHSSARQHHVCIMLACVVHGCLPAGLRWPAHSCHLRPAASGWCRCCGLLPEVRALSPPGQGHAWGMPAGKAKQRNLRRRCCLPVCHAGLVCWQTCIQHAWHLSFLTAW